MDRNSLTAESLGPLLEFLSPRVARKALNLEVERQSAVPSHVEEVELALDVQNRANPDGVPLSMILHEVQRATPSVVSLMARGRTIVVTYNQKPNLETRRKVNDVLQDTAKFAALVPPNPVVTGPTAVELRGILADPATPDAEWLRVFREFAVHHLLPK